MNEYQGRIARLQELMREAEARLIVIAGTDQMRYLTGWREGGHERFVGLLIPASGDPAFVVPAMNAPQAAQTSAGIAQVIGWDDGPGWHEAVQSLFATWRVGGADTVLADDELLSVHLLAMQHLFPNMHWEAAGPTMTRLREIKTPEELAAMQQAADLIDGIFEEAVGALQEGMTERDLADIVLAAIKAKGSSPSFSPLICFGANAALPHHHTGSARLKRGDVVIIDIGCTSDHYASDITRTVSFGPPADPDAASVYEIVFKAHQTAREAAQPGVSGEQVDAAARKVIIDAGYGEYFIHRTGHGIGLSTHEPPNIVKGNIAPLQPGMCFSIEPGIYLPGRFGVRVENIVTMTSEGARSLDAEASPTLRIIGS